MKFAVHTHKKKQAVNFGVPMTFLLLTPYQVNLPDFK